MADPRSFRPRRADDLGLRRALSDRLLPMLVAAMSFLAALALAGAIAAAMLATHWREGAGDRLTVQVPDPDAQGAAGTRAEAVRAVLDATPGIAAARRLSDQEFLALLRPWLGTDPAALSLKLPALYELRLTTGTDATALAARLDPSLTHAAPGTLMDRNTDWLLRLRALIASVQLCAALSLGLVAGIAAAVVAIATRAGLAARRDAIHIVHGLGATDGAIARQFAARIGTLSLAGGLLGVCLAIPVLLGLASLAAPFASVLTTPADQPPLSMLSVLPPALWAGLAALPLCAFLIAWCTTQATVRLWLARLP